MLQRPERLEDALDPVALMSEAVGAAASDARATGLPGRAQLYVAVRGAWGYSDPARLVAESFGATGARTALTTAGGNTPQTVLNVLARRISAGELDAAVLVGGETIWSRRRLRRLGIERRTSSPTGAVPDEVLGSELAAADPAAQAVGLEDPIHFYPTFESAIRRARGETVEGHRTRIARLWERFNAVAVENPYAWSRRRMTAVQIREPTPENRMVGFPYTKAMNSNWDLDQAAALIICSAGAAADAGVPADRWVFLHGAVDSQDTALVSNRETLAGSRPLAAAGRRALELAGVGADDVGHIDLYSCFPSAVQIAAAGIGIGEDRPLTVTGGLTFAGGPLNNYVSHSVATMLGVLRSDQGSRGLITGLGGFLTKHAAAIYSTDPPAAGFRWERAGNGPDAPVSRRAAADHVGPVEVEAYTVMHGPGGPEVALFACLTAEGARTWGRSTDPALMKTGVTEELIGRRAHVDGSRTVTIL